VTWNDRDLEGDTSDYEPNSGWTVEGRFEGFDNREDDCAL